MQVEKKEFSRLRSLFFPIHNEEMNMFFLLGTLMFVVVFNYTILRNVKDCLINTAETAGPEVISFIKGWCTTPAAFLFFLFYTKISNHVNRQNLFYIVFLSFLIFFIIFAFVIYPNATLFHPSTTSIELMQTSYPRFQWIFPVYGIWTYVLYYVCAELWGSAIVAFLFWQLANDIISTGQAARFYPMLNLFANFGLILSGIISEVLSNYLNTGTGSWVVILQSYSMIMFIAGSIGIMAYRKLNLFLASMPSKESSLSIRKSKLKLSVIESIKNIISSPYIALILVIVLGYNISLNLVEIVWKKQLALHYTDPASYSAFMGRFYGFMGLSAILIVFTCKNLMVRYSWAFGALVTPVTLLITAVVFFSMLYVSPFSSTIAYFFGVQATTVLVVFGAFQNLATKGTKYALYDPSKEMAYIPLKDEELKVKGKASVDILGARLGKAGGGFIQQLLLIITAGNIITITPFLIWFVIAIVLTWLWAVLKLNEKYKKLNNSSEENAADKSLEVSFLKV